MFCNIVNNVEMSNALTLDNEKWKGESRMFVAQANK